MQFRKHITVDLRSGAVADVALGPVFRDDAQANVVAVRVLDGGSPANLAGCAVKGLILRSDGIALSVDGGVDGSDAWVELPDVAYDVRGDLSVAVRLHDGTDDRTTLAVFRGHVVETASDEIYDPDEMLMIRTVDAAYMEAVLDRIQIAIDQANEVRDGAVLYSSWQGLTSQQAAQARKNIGADPLFDGVIVSTDHSGSSGRAAFIPCAIKSGETVYVDVDLVPAGTDATYGVYLSQGTTPYPQSAEKDGPGRTEFVASRDYHTVVLWFNTAPVSMTAKVFTSGTLKAARKVNEAAATDYSSGVKTFSSKTAAVPFRVEAGDAVWVNVSNIVGSGYVKHQIAFGDTSSALTPAVDVTTPGPARLIAPAGYNYVFVYVDCTSVTSARITICRDALKSRYRTYSILGDSYSAYEGTIPSGNLKSYPISGNDVNDPSQMWWRVYGDKNGAALELNESWSGASVCNYAYGADQSDKSFVTRVKNLPESDLIFILGGTNDDWGSAALGSYVYSGWTAEQLNQFRPAFAYVLSWIQAHRPASDAVVIINSGLSADFATSMRTIAAHYSVPVVELANIAKVSGHPNKAGMGELGGQVSDALLTRTVDSHAYDGNLTAVAERLGYMEENVATRSETLAYLNITQ